MRLNAKKIQDTCSKRQVVLKGVYCDIHLGASLS